MIKELKDCLIKKIRQDYSDNASEIDKKIRKIEEAKNIRDLGITMQKAIEILKQNGMPIVLTEEDKRIFQNFSETIKGTEDLVLVHKTDFAPTEAKIATASETGGITLSDATITINGQEEKIKYKQNRTVVNFAVNHEVKSHGMGNWDKKKYVVIIPWDSIPEEKIVGGVPADVFTDR